VVQRVDLEAEPGVVELQPLARGRGLVLPRGRQGHPLRYDQPAMDDDYLALARRALRPHRPRLREARAVVEGIADPQVAWDRLSASGIMPDLAAFDPGRTFERAGFGGKPYPPTIPMAVALASDSASVVAVEDLARVCAMRLPGSRSALTVRWRLGRLTQHDLLKVPPREPTGLLHTMLLGIHDEAPTTEWDTEPAWVIHPQVPRRRWPSRRECRDRVALGRLTREISAAELWQSAALYGYRLTEAGPCVAELPDPFEPLFAIWRSGYAIDVIEEDAIVLVAPDIEGILATLRRCLVGS
jgi:hypothetical protein